MNLRRYLLLAREGLAEGRRILGFITASRKRAEKGAHQNGKVPLFASPASEKKQLGVAEGIGKCVAKKRG